MPVNLKKFWISKNLVLIEKLLLAAFVLALLMCTSNIISPATAMFTPGKSIMGSIVIRMGSIWQIPFCLFLTFKVGMFVPIVANTAFGIFFPSYFGNSSFWWLFPYCWAPKLAEPLMGIGVNGTLIDYNGISELTIALTLVLSLLLFIAFTYLGAENFNRQEAK